MRLCQSCSSAVTLQYGAQGCDWLGGECRSSRSTMREMACSSSLCSLKARAFVTAPFRLCLGIWFTGLCVMLPRNPAFYPLAPR